MTSESGGDKDPSSVARHARSLRQVSWEGLSSVAARGPALHWHELAQHRADEVIGIRVSWV